MKAKAVGYKLEPYITIYLVPETDVERVLLKQLWTQGHLKLGNGCADGTGQGFGIEQKPKVDDE